MTSDSSKLFERAKQSIPGGVNSPVRSFKALGGTPVFIKGAKGAYLQGVDGKDYLDLICSWGAMILGHADPQAAETVKEQALRGVSFGAATEAEVVMAEQIKSMMPSIELLRMVNSGTEATMSAIRLARGYTGRNKIIKFNGCYHGHSDCMLTQAGSGVLAMSNPSSPGVPKEMVRHTLNLEFNDAEQLSEAFKREGDDLAAVIIEPIAGNMNLVPAAADYLRLLRELCTKHNTVLIFDEVMSGFRVARGGATEIYAIQPDILCLGKVIGGGLPVGAFGGKREIMENLAPLGSVYQAGTLSGNPLVTALGMHCLQHLDAGVYKKLTSLSDKLAAGINAAAKDSPVKVCAAARSGMLGIYYGLERPPTNLTESQQQDAELFKKIFFALLEEGVHLPPSHFEACFLSTAHTEAEIDKLLQSFGKILAEL